ncbi:MAG: phosphate ABC transporter substrate-binding protein [Methanobacteriaceae archaeon]|jgi:phosphate transport system substrate-binding protein
MDEKYIIGIIAAIVIVGAIGAFFVFARPPAPEEQRIHVVGSTSAHPLVEMLAEAYMQKNPHIRIDAAGPGTGEGIRTARDGIADIGTASRELEEEEKPGLVQFPIARDGIAIVVHPENPVGDLTVEQIRGIYLGEITNWAEVGGPDEPISVITREEGSGTRGAFEDMVMDDEAIMPGAIIQDSTGAVMHAVGADPNAIGYGSLAYIVPEVKALNVGGVTPSIETILDGTYPVSRPFLFLTKGEPTGHVKEFIDWVLGPEGQAIVEGEDLVPVK